VQIQARQNEKQQEELLHVVVISYELCFDTFSGNGVLATSLVKSLLLQHGCRVSVWCCRPHNDADEDHHDRRDDHEQRRLKSLRVLVGGDDDDDDNGTGDAHERLAVYATQLSRTAGWRRLDADSGWREFVFQNLDEKSRSELPRRLQSANCVVAVDWTGAYALRSLLAHGMGLSIPVVYLNFRVYSSGCADPERRRWYDEMETAAHEDADIIIALSEKDRESLRKLLQRAIAAKSKENSPVKPPPVEVLLPPLRGDIEELVLQPSENLAQYLPSELERSMPKCDASERLFITCVVRLSPEKDTMRFVKFCEALRDVMDRLGYIPILAGSASDPDYAREVKKQLRAVCPHAVILESFLPPAALAAIFARSVLNFHPCAYDAYGMTVVEAAAFRVPSVVASGGHVGATAIVGEGASIQVTIDNGGCCGLSAEAVEIIKSALNDRERLLSIGAKAREAALAWDEAAYGAALLEHVRRLVSTKELLR